MCPHLIHTEGVGSTTAPILCRPPARNPQEIWMQRGAAPS